MPPDRDAISLQDILDASADIADFLVDIDRDAFHEDRKTQAAVIQRLLVIGEAVKRLSDSFCERHASIPWNRIARTRDILVHHYEGVDLGEVWRIAVDEVPALKREIGPILQALLNKR